MFELKLYNILHLHFNISDSACKFISNFVITCHCFSEVSDVFLQSVWGNFVEFVVTTSNFVVWVRNPVSDTSSNKIVVDAHLISAEELGVVWKAVVRQRFEKCWKLCFKQVLLCFDLLRTVWTKNAFVGKLWEEITLIMGSSFLTFVFGHVVSWDLVV